MGRKKSKHGKTYKQHGGLDTGSKTPHVWDDTMDETVNNGELLRLAAEYLKSKGFSVRV